MVTRLIGAINICNQFFSKTVILLLLAVPHLTFAGELKPFTTDGCSSFPEGTLEQQSLWAECCILHDLAYWQGGTYNDRLTADQQLQSCVTAVGEPEIAQLIPAGVSVGGTPYLPTPFRWGYGCSWPRRYRNLDEDKKVQVKINLENPQIMLKRLSEELKKETD